MNRFPVLERVVVSDYRLYPGTVQNPGIDFHFKNGISLLAGINGLGKTTMINMLFRLLVGPFDLPKDAGSAKFGSAAKAGVTSWSGRTNFFAQRVADRAASAVATLHFSVGDSRFIVSRALATLRMQSCQRDGVPLLITNDEGAYQAALCEAADAGQFVDFVTAVKYLTFFNEERRDILWDEQAQRQFFRILFTRPDEAREWIKIEQQISSADSRARNISASVYQLEGDLKKAQDAIVTNVGLDARLAAEQKLLDADLRRRKELEAQTLGLEDELKKVRRNLERAKLNEDAARRDVEEVRFRRLAGLFPSLPDTARYVLTQIFADGRCLACEQGAPEAQERMQTALENGLCVVCGSDLAQSPRVSSEVGDDPTDKAMALSRENLVHASVERESLAKAERERDLEWRGALKELGDLATQINQRHSDVKDLRTQLPPPPEEIEKLRSSIAELREREATEKGRRQSAEAVYERLLGRVNERIEAAASHVGKIFQGFIESFLEEQCKLSFVMIEDRPSQSGRKFKYPSLRFEMTAAAFEGAQIRDTPDDVSESQREFIDLGFRMALCEAASVDGAMSMVVETPEASLDAIFMVRAAEMFRKFATGPRSVIVTSNLTSSVMIPALMGDRTSDVIEIDSRRERVLNLLKLAAPNAALRRHGKQYDEFLEEGLKGVR
jgi:hypothetical protein